MDEDGNLLMYPPKKSQRNKKIEEDYTMYDEVRDDELD